MTITAGNLSVVVGGQYGSEAKGAVTAWLTRRILAEGQTPMVVRVAGPNAGHTAYDRRGRKWALRQVPVGMVVSPRAVGMIADGSEIDLPVLLDEIRKLDEAGLDVSSRLLVSPYATILAERHHEAEANRELVGRLGSTGKGVGAARSDRVMRIADVPDLMMRAGLDLVKEDTWEELYPTALGEGGGLAGLDKLNWIEYPSGMVLDQLMTDGMHVVIEGTQGYGLGVHRPEYPKTTSSDCRAIDFLAMAGVSPWSSSVSGMAVWLVVRAHPIRVAGNSGPLLGETSWSELGLPEELTTVTQKVRRVGRWDQRLFDQAVEANGGRGVRVAYTMADQEWPSIRGLDGSVIDGNLELDDETTQYLNQVAHRTRDLTAYVGTGPQTAIWNGHEWSNR